MTQEQIVGIIGGMGPEATVDLMHHIIRLTPAQQDNDHIRCIVDNNTKIPSRIKALYEHSGISPAPMMCDSARRLESYGVDFLIIPCNTAHYYYDDVQAAVSIPVLHILDITVAAAQRTIPNLRHIGLLATTATVNTGMYATRFAAAGVNLVLPDTTHQQATLDLIKAIKAGQTGADAAAQLDALAADLAAQGAQAVVLGCTELGIVAKAHEGIPLIDAVIELARATVLRVKGRTAAHPFNMGESL